jgi:hypothetical chaperone protein
MSFCAIDFGTSNSAIAIPGEGAVRSPSGAGMTLVELEPGHRTMPTAVFYFAETGDKAFGRAALEAYVDGHEGRLMRSMKSLLGSHLMEQTTEIGGGLTVRYVDVVAGYLRRLRDMAQAAAGRSLSRAVLGRPVFFVDGDPARDAAAQAGLEEAARAVGFTEVAFQYEPIAAAFDYEASVQTEQIVLVADIGGGTSDFSLVRIGPSRCTRLDRKDDILANHGVHVAGTDFDRRVELAGILRELGYKAKGPTGREVPHAVYFDLATWHLINTVYTPARIAELKLMGYFYGDAKHHQRLMKVVTYHLGHALANLAEHAKIAVSAGGSVDLDLSLVEPGLTSLIDEAQVVRAVEDDIERIVATARETARLGGIADSAVDAVYFTGGSTGLRFLVQRLASAFPQAQPVFGDRLASVAAGLGLHAARLFGPTA